MTLTAIALNCTLKAEGDGFAAHDVKTGVKSSG
jgi:hypothetical protein